MSIFKGRGARAVAVHVLALALGAGCSAGPSGEELVRQERAGLICPMGTTAMQTATGQYSCMTSSYTAGFGLQLTDLEFSVNTSQVQARVASACPVGQAIRSIAEDGSAVCGSPFTRTVVVSPVGTPQENGVALLAALGGITGASATNPYLLKLEPGVYDLGAQGLDLRPHVSVEGSGEASTIVQGTRQEYQRGQISAINLGADPVELRALTVRCSGVTNTIFGVFVSGSSVRLSQLSIALTVDPAGNGSAVGVAVWGASNAQLDRVQVQVSGGAGAGDATGLSVSGTSTARLFDVRASVSKSAGQGYSVGMYVSSSAAASLDQVALSAAGGVYTYGLNGQGGSAAIRGSTFTANGGNTVAGIVNFAVAMSLENATASGVGPGAMGLASYSSAGTAVHGSRLSGTAYGVFNGGGTARFATSQLSGGTSATGTLAYGGGVVSCFGSYGVSWTALSAACN